MTSGLRQRSNGTTISSRRPKRQVEEAATMKSVARVLSILALVLLQHPRCVEAFSPPRSTKKPVEKAIWFQQMQSPGSFSLYGDPKTSSRRIVQQSITSKDTDYGEDSRRFRRTNYNNESWLRHRSSDRLIRNFYTMIFSGIFRQLLREVSVVASVSMMIILWNCALVVGYEDFAGHHHGPLFDTSCFPLLELPRDPFVLSSPALGLLLVFRTDTSYARWDEARKAWGIIVNHSRNIMRTSSTWVSRNSDTTSLDCQQAMDALSKAVWAFPRSLQRQYFGAVEDDISFQQDVRRRLDPQQAEALIRAADKPNRALHDLSHAVHALPLDYLRRMQIDQSVVHLVDALGTCERIFASPVPLVYTRHTARFVTCWMFLLPFALWSPFVDTWNHMGMVPSAAVIAFFFFGIEELAVQLEEPFSVLPLDAIVNRIDRFIVEYQVWNKEDDLSRPERFFLDDPMTIDSEVIDN